jgi:Putative beta-barrel porin-2, OmpL-like. bbp2
MGRDVRYAPGEENESFSPFERKEDPAVSRAAYSAPQDTLPSPPLPSGSLGIANDGMGAAATVTGEPQPGDVPLSLAPLPGPIDQPVAADTNDTANEPLAPGMPAPGEREPYSLCKRFLRGYPRLVLWFPNYLGPPREGGPSLYGDELDDTETARAGERSGGGGYEAPGAPRRSPPSPWDSPPFPTSEYQGYPLIGVPASPNEDPLQKALLLGPNGDWWRDTRIEFHGWATAGGNWSNANKSNLPTAYWIVPNTIQLDQLVYKLEREIDWVQEDHIDWGFKTTGLFGIDYRYTTAGGVFSQQLLYHNNLYGFDPVEFYGELYIPRVFDGMTIRLGRWIACPDIEAQYAPDNYLASHSLLFTYDTYTQTGAMFSFQLNQRNMVQGAIQSGTDMAPWYVGALPTGFFGWRWVSQSNNDALYTCLNNINNAKFRYFMADGQKAGHDNFNYLVTTWEHRFSKKIHTKTEAYFMWQFDAVVGGTPSLGPVMSFGGGGGLGKFIPGASLTYGILNYTMFQLSKRDYFTVRNEWFNDAEGERTGFATSYSSHTIGISHQINDLLMIRPEIGFYHSYGVPAFNLGKSNNLLMGGFDFTIRF